MDQLIPMKTTEYLHVSGKTSTQFKKIGAEKSLKLCNCKFKVQNLISEIECSKA